MKLKKQQRIIAGVILIALILIVSFAFIMMSNNDDVNNSNNNNNNDGSSNGDGTNGNGDTNGDGDSGDGDGDNGDNGGSQLTGGWIDLSGNIEGDPYNPYFTDIHAIGDEVWLTSSISDIYYSADGGATFTTQSVGTSTNSIFMKSSIDGYAAGVDGRVYRTTDGSTWHVLNGTLLNQINSISFPLSGDGRICGNNGWVGNVDSTGITGTEQLAVSTLFSISCPTTSDEAWLCGCPGICMHYNGSSWNSIIIGGAGSLASVYFVPNTTEGWVVGDGGLIVHSSDGTSFSPQTNPNTLVVTFNDVFSLDGQHAWIVGGGGRILHTTNGGSEWVMEAEGMTTESFQAVFFTSPTNGYAVGANNLLLKYTGE